MVLKLGHFGKKIRNSWRVLKGDGGEGQKINWNNCVRNDIFYGIHIRTLTIKIQEFANKCTVLQYKVFTIKTLGL
jgi:hypothetical protein